MSMTFRFMKQVMELYGKFHEDIQETAGSYPLMPWTVTGLAAAVSKMAFGNGCGVKIEHNLDPRDFFAPGFGDLIAEVPAGGSWKSRRFPIL